MKKTNKPNPLKVFNDNNAKARMKAGGAMSEYKKYLKKAQDGMSFNNTYQGPLTESDIKRLDREFPSTATQIPYASKRPNMGYGTEDQYRKIEKEDRSAFENYLRSPAVGVNNKRLGTGLNKEGIWNQKYNRNAQLIEMNNMNNIDWNSEEGKHRKKILDRDYNESFKKGGSVKKKMAVGGSSDSDCWPGKPGCGAEKARRVNKRRRFWNSDAGKTVKKVGAGVAAAGAGAAAYAKNVFKVKDAIKGLSEQKKGGSVKRKK